MLRLLDENCTLAQCKFTDLESVWKQNFNLTKEDSVVSRSFSSAVQVFYPGQSKPVFFVASRGHHADIGGSAPGLYQSFLAYQNDIDCQELFSVHKLLNVCLLTQDSVQWF